MGKFIEEFYYGNIVKKLKIFLLFRKRTLFYIKQKNASPRFTFHHDKQE